MTAFFIVMAAFLLVMVAFFMETNDGRQQWTHEAIKCMLEICLEEIGRVGRNGQSLRRESWGRVGAKLKEEFGFVLNEKQIRNAFDTMKSKYVGWCYLRNKTGNLYNPQTNMFTLTPQEWDDFKKGHPRAMSLRTRPLPHPDLFIAVFEGLSATGGNQWTSTQTSGVSSSTQVQTLQIEGASVHLEDDDGDSHEQSFPMGDEDPINNEGPSVQPNDDSEVRPKKKAKTSKNSITLDDLASDMRDALKHMVKNMEGPSIDECYEKLKSVGLEPIDPLFLGAFNIFGQSTYMRQAWMTLPSDPEVLKEWIKMTGTTLGMFK
ncbi:putative Myb/SANT-like domain-containing protein [Helianthus annuus]|uniref:Myb/SANT-like domain-containing protein n=2 Tax=Helianthus annuus TaxID=4232 RepID=A0A9K3N3N3_HELAN|nr:putative Myb/SANT-like domain-containing protein [Helianthus annuus]